MSSAVLTAPVVIRNDEDVQRRLSALNDARLRPGGGLECGGHATALGRFDATQSGGMAAALQTEMDLRKLEATFIESERALIADRAALAPRDADAFVVWFEALRDTGPGQNDALFPWIAEQATMDQIGWFLSQEVAGEAGFDDLVALTQLKLPVRAKLEMARNYWDEMGRGRESGMHGPMLDRLAADLRLSEKTHAITWEAIAVGNLLMGLAANRAYAFHSIGALGAIELTAPSRASRVSEGLQRLGVPLRTRRYYALHATLDIKHSEAWNEEVLKPLVRDDPRLARPIAEGALMRLNAGARSFARYRHELGR